MLPIYQVRSEIVDALKTGCAIITAPTGSGKSTQVPQMLLDCVAQRILVLQPRRIAARMLAERVAFERGEEPGKTVGYHTRYERVFSKDTRILFVTEGILTRMLAESPALPGIDAIIFDEFHERSLNTDLGIAMAWNSKNTLRNDLRIVVMSATMDASPISAFLDNAPIISSSGRMYDVDISYCTQADKLEGPADAAASALSDLLATNAPGDVLVFMPGSREIRKTIDACSKLPQAANLELLPLYGDLPPAEQRRVMQPATKRKVIVATNIAETSLTIPGVRHVIDSGLARQAKYNAVRGVDTLDTVPIARDSADQRAGRAGREAPGTCRRLWTWLEHSAKTSRTLPEIHRVDLAEAVLAVNAFGFTDAMAFPWFEQPAEKQIRIAEALLEELGAIAPNHGGITELGRRLQSIPTHPRLALLMWLGAEHGCLELTSWAVAILNSRPLMLSGAIPRRKRSNSNDALPPSDFLALINAAQSAKEANFAQDFCQRQNINPASAREIARIAQDCLDTAKRAGWNHRPSQFIEKAFLQCILRVFPDRLAKRISNDSNLCELPGGRHGELDAASVVKEYPLFISAEVREGTSGKLQLSLASGIEEDWLLDIFPDAWEDIDEAYWDEKRQQVLRRMELRCLGVRLEEKVRFDPNPDKAAQILTGLLASGKIPFPWDTENADKWIDRVKWVAQVFPEKNLPDYSDMTPALHELCQGANSIKSIKDRDYLTAVKNMLSYDEQRFVEKMAPAIIVLPNGRKMKVDYAPNTTPKGRSRIQDFYDLGATPTVAGGRVKILLDILAPNNRTVQITDDLANFWKELYPKIKPELSRRYPRHLWK